MGPHAEGITDPKTRETTRPDHYAVTRSGCRCGFHAVAGDSLLDHIATLTCPLNCPHRESERVPLGLCERERCLNCGEWLGDPR